MPFEKSPLWQLAFRPFFLFAGLFGLLAIALWLLIFFQVVRYRGTFDPMTWHSHEMIYGFTSAILAGFVMTAIQNWTGIRGVHGVKLQIIFLIWMLARVLLVLVPHPSVIVTAVDLSFFPLLAAYLFSYFRDPELRIERVFFAYFALFFAGNVLIHLESLGWISGYSRRGALLGLHTTIVVIVFMGGRVIPFFTESSIAKIQPRTFPLIESMSHLTAWLFLGSQFLASESPLSAVLAFAATFVHAIRLWGWQVRRVRRVPLLWVLHVGYAWILVGFALSGLATLGLIAAPPAIHAFAVGALGMVVYGMITRVSLGHTGRRLHPATLTVAGYFVLGAAAVVRVVFPLMSNSLHGAAVLVSGLLWVVALALFLYVYWPLLTRPRVDGAKG